MLRGIHKEHDRFVDTYWSRYPDVYFAGDGARVDEDRDFWLLGRVDDVMNVSGAHRSRRIEGQSKAVDHQSVAEAAVRSRGSDDRSGDRRLRDAEGGQRRLGGDARGAARPRRLEDRSDREAGQHRLHPRGRRRGAARSCAATHDVAENRSLGDTTTLADPPSSTRSASAPRPDERRVDPRVATARDRLDLIDRAWSSQATLPEYNRHGDVLEVYWPRLTEERPDFQFQLVDGDEPVARADRSQCAGTAAWTTPPGSTARSRAGFDEGDANVLCALIVCVPRSLQGRGLRRLVLQAMTAIARAHGLRLDRPRAPELEGALSAGADRPLRVVAPAGRGCSSIRGCGCTSASAPSS